MVIQANGRADVIAGFEILGLQIRVRVQQEDAIHDAVGPVVVGHAQLFIRA